MRSLLRPPLMNALTGEKENRANPWSALVRTWALMMAILLSQSSFAASPAVEVSNVWARATVPGQKVAGVYLELRAQRPTRLVSVKSAASASAEIHSMSVEAGVMKMRQLDSLPLPAGETVALRPNGNHIMLLDIKRQLKPGDKIPVTLVVEEGGKRWEITVEAEVRAVQ